MGVTGSHISFPPAAPPALGGLKPSPAHRRLPQNGSNFCLGSSAGGCRGCVCSTAGKDSDFGSSGFQHFGIPCSGSVCSSLGGKKCLSGLPPGPGQSRGCWGGRGPNLSLSPLPALPTANPRWFWGKKPVQSHLHAGLVARQRCDPRRTPRMRAGAPRSPRPWRGPCPKVSGVPAPGWFHISYLGH